MITYKEIDSTYLERIKEIYEAEGWMAYLNNDDKLKSALDHSLYILGAFEDDKLVGFIRCLGDGEHAVTIQDLIIDKEHQRKKIGTTLMNKMFEKYSAVRFIQVNTDIEDERDNAFYKAMGMRTLESVHMISYCR